MMFLTFIYLNLLVLFVYTLCLLVGLWLRYEVSAAAAANVYNDGLYLKTSLVKLSLDNMRGYKCIVKIRKSCHQVTIQYARNSIESWYTFNRVKVMFMYIYYQLKNKDLKIGQCDLIFKKNQV